MDPDLLRAIRRVTFLLLALSAMSVEIAAVDTRPTFESLGLASVWVGFAFILTWFIPIPAKSNSSPPRIVSLLLVVLLALPFWSSH